MAADYPLSEKVKNDTEVTADLAIFVAAVRGGNAGGAGDVENCPRSRVAKGTERRLEVQ
jgi:hypothetical protein